ncbi:hypothetical protein LINPERHAP2_LOCUS39220, partial [Linum perenne]
STSQLQLSSTTQSIHIQSNTNHSSSKHCTSTIQYTQHTPVTPTHTHTCISKDYLDEFIRRHKEFILHHPCRPDAPLSPGEVQDASSPLEDTTRPFP